MTFIFLKKSKFKAFLSISIIACFSIFLIFTPPKDFVSFTLKKFCNLIQIKSSYGHQFDLYPHVKSITNSNEFFSSMTYLQQASSLDFVICSNELILLEYSFLRPSVHSNLEEFILIYNRPEFEHYSMESKTYKNIAPDYLLALGLIFLSAGLVIRKITI